MCECLWSHFAHSVFHSALSTLWATVFDLLSFPCGVRKTFDLKPWTASPSMPAEVNCFCYLLWGLEGIQTSFFLVQWIQGVMNLEKTNRVGKARLEFPEEKSWPLFIRHVRTSYSEMPFDYWSSALEILNFFSGQETEGWRSFTAIQYLQYKIPRFLC